jgi:PAS domain S-box-containing protein
MLGSTPERLREAPLWSLAQSDDAEVLERQFRATADDGVTRYVEWGLVDLRGGAAARQIETRISRVPGEGGEVLMFCISRSVDGKYGRELDLRRRYEEGRAFIDRAIYGIYRSTANGRFVYVNQALIRMLGYESVTELLGIDMASQLYADPAERDLLVRRFREQRLGEWTHARWKRKDGSQIVVRMVVSGLTDDKGEITGFEGIVEDVTERLRREEILRRNERMASLGTMLAGVAHELNNPLAAISGFAQIMLRGTSLSDEDRGAVETINHEANRAARIVRDLQTFARERSWEQREQVDLNEVVSYILASQRYTMDSHGVRREVSLAPALPLVRAERAHMEQILINLLANASQALQSITNAPAERGNGSTGKVPPSITVRTGIRGSEVFLEVQDNGPGISAANLPRIFDPFFTTRAEGEGTGLGLAVVHGIVTSYGGNLEVESEEGNGSLFRVSFPGVTEEPPRLEEPAQAAETPTPTSQAAKPLEILVVEDEGAIRRLLARYFESRGHAVTTAQDGSAALRHAEQSAFDVVICDLRLPGIDGVEVLKRIRELPTGERSRCILMSGANAREPAGQLSELLRLSAIIDKPFEIEQLRAAVETAVETG